jgi:hypothetical protein
VFGDLLDREFGFVVGGRLRKHALIAGGFKDFIVVEVWVDDNP